MVYVELVSMLGIFDQVIFCQPYCRKCILSDMMGGIGFILCVFYTVNYFPVRSKHRVRLHLIYIECVLNHANKLNLTLKTCNSTSASIVASSSVTARFTNWKSTVVLVIKINFKRIRSNVLDHNLPFPNYRCLRSIV